MPAGSPVRTGLTMTVTLSPGLMMFDFQPARIKIGRAGQLDAPEHDLALAVRDVDLNPGVRVLPPEFLDRTVQRDFLRAVERGRRVMRKSRSDSRQHHGQHTSEQMPSSSDPPVDVGSHLPIITGCPPRMSYSEWRTRWHTQRLTGWLAHSIVSRPEDLCRARDVSRTLRRSGKMVRRSSRVKGKIALPTFETNDDMPAVSETALVHHHDRRLTSTARVLPTDSQRRGARGGRIRVAPCLLRATQGRHASGGASAFSHRGTHEGQRRAFRRTRAMQPLALADRESIDGRSSANTRRCRPAGRIDGQSNSSDCFPRSSKRATSEVLVPGPLRLTLAPPFWRQLSPDARRGRGHRSRDGPARRDVAVAQLAQVNFWVALSRDGSGVSHGGHIAFADAASAHGGFACANDDSARRRRWLLLLLFSHAAAPASAQAEHVQA